MENLDHIKTAKQLVATGIEDLELCFGNPQYVVNMDNFHVSKCGCCEICMAGSIMAQTLKTPIEETVSIDDFPFLTGRKLCLLDLIRSDDAIGVFGIAGFPEPKNDIYAGVDRNALSYGDLDEWRKLHANL